MKKLKSYCGYSIELFRDKDESTEYIKKVKEPIGMSLFNEYSDALSLRFMECNLIDDMIYDNEIRNGNCWAYRIISEKTGKTIFECGGYVGDAGKDEAYDDARTFVHNLIIEDKI